MDNKRYEDKIRRQKDEIARLTGALQEAEQGTAAINLALDAILAAAAMEYGAEQEEEGKRLGWQLSLQIPNVKEVAARYEVHARREGERYIIGVAEREGAEE